MLGLAAEFAVASELCRRNVYAQLTLGMRRRVDILVETESEMLRIQVKAKQRRVWPGCKGIYGDDIVLVFVDFESKGDEERPDFYILTSEDWKDFIEKELKPRISKGEVIINDRDVPIWHRQIGKSGKAYEGTDVRPAQIKQHKERWDKITGIVKGNIA